MKKTASLLPGALLLGALLAGCASTPAKPTADQEAAQRASRLEASLKAATLEIEIASPEMLSQAATILTGEDARGTPEALALTSFGGRLFTALYPDLSNPFPAPTMSVAPEPLEKDVPAGSKFFEQIAPGLALLLPGPAPDEQAAGIFVGLTYADSLNPASVLPPYLRAVLLERQQKPPWTFRPLYEECLRRDPGFYPAKEGIIRSAIAQGSAAGEVELLVKYAGELPNRLESQIMTARIYLAAGQPRQAADTTARAMLLAPDSTELVILRARAFEAMGNWYQSLAILNDLLRIAPDEKKAIAMKARLLFEKSGDPDGAMRIAAESASKFPDDPAFPELQGRILLARGNSVEGDANLAAALAIDPSRVSTLALLARSAAQAERWEEASGYMARIPSWKMTADILQLGWQIAMKRSDFDAALAYAQTLEKKAGGDSSLLFRVRTLVAAGRFPEATQLATADLATASAPAARASLYYLRATTERGAGGDPAAALSDLRSALRENPDDRESLLAIADVLGDAGDYRRALGYLRHAQELSPEDAAIRARVNDVTRLASPEN